MKKQTLYWLVPRITPRISYLAKTLFSNWESIVVTPVISAPPENERVLNSTASPHPNQIQLPLISKVLLEERKASCSPGALPNLAEANLEDLDWLEISFWLLTEYVNYVQPTFDQFDRYDFRAIWHTNFFQKPYVDLFINRLSLKILDKWPALSLSKPNFKTEITCDIDHLFAFRGKNYLQIIKKILLSVYRKDLACLKAIGNYLIKRADPYEKPWKLLLKTNPEQLRFFVLLSNEHKRDSTYKPDFQPLITKIQDLFKLGYSVGIHPSYLAMENPKLIEDQYNFLKKIAAKEIVSSRQHYLRYRLPSTYQKLISLGITEEYTSCLPQMIGYKYGTCRPFFWYDIQNELTTNLKIFPTVAMDRTLLEDMALSPGQAATRLAQLKGDIQAVGGDFRVLIHPEALSNTFEWKGWQQTFTQLFD